MSGVKRLDASRSGDQSAPLAGKRAQSAVGGGAVPDKAEAFEEFKTQDGAEVNRQLKENVAALKDKKLAQKDLATRINAVKSEIDAIQTQVRLLSLRQRPFSDVLAAARREAARCRS